MPSHVYFGVNELTGYSESTYATSKVILDA